MTLATRPAQTGQTKQIQLATFYLGELCLAVEIAQIQEIMRDVRVTRVPYAPPQVSGVINLRGEVSTIIDLRLVLSLPPAPAGASRRTLIVRSQGESIGLIVERVADIMTVDAHAIVPAPPNVGAVDGRFIRGVCPRDSEIIVVLDLEQTLQTTASSRSRSA
jgi:purine-binding chemotaxis protein CheW